MEPFGMIAQAAGDIGLGLITQGINNRNQISQQKKLNELQFDIDGRALARQKSAELQQWKDTSYGAQLKEMKDNNLSPGMIYGGSGGGAGQLGGSAGSVSAPKATAGNGMDLMTVAQRKLIEAQTENVKADTVKKSGVDTDLTKWQARQAMNVSQFYVDTYGDNYRKVKAELEILENQAKTSHETQSTEVKLKQAELVGLGIANELKRAQKGLTEEQMKATAEMVKQKWQEVNIKQGHLDLDKFIKDVKESTKLTTESIIRVIGLLK